MSKDKMSNDRQEIAQKVRDGSYFKDAREWYALKYLYPASERSIICIFTVVAFVALIPIATLLKLATSSTDKLPFPIYVADSATHVSVIKPLIQGTETVQESVARHLIFDYVMAREEYIYSTMTSEKLKKLLKKIKSSSAKQVLNEYTAYMNENNPYSPLTLYKDHVNRLISNLSLSFLDKDKTSGRAKVIFDATEQSPDGKSKVSTWEASIDFKLPDIETIAKSGAPLRFVVSYYRAKPIGAVKSEPAATNTPQLPPAADEKSPAGKPTDNAQEVKTTKPNNQKQ